jgi:transposase
VFIRKKKNDSGKICVQVIDKTGGKYKVLFTVGSSHDPNEVLGFIFRAKLWMKEKAGSIELDFANESVGTNEILDAIQNLRLIGLELLLGKIFDEIGFNQIEDEVFRYLVLHRLVFPRSKLKTTQYLYRYHYLDWDENQIYRYLDKLYDSQKELVQKISYDHTVKILGNEIQLVFYDVTTLYFEIDNEDQLRRTGFSKEGKHQNPQIVLGLLVSRDGYPLSYEIFEGSKFEGHTMLPVIETFCQKFGLEKVIIVADAGLLSRSNIEELGSKGYEFILGARIKNESEEIRKKILELKWKDGKSKLISKGDLRLVVSYSDSRAGKDKYNRERGLRKLEKKIKSGKLTKANLTNRGYNKYLKLKGKVQVTIDMEKFEQDSRWDGLKGYLTNSSLSKEEIMENYKQLWQIEKAFRVTKSEIKIRPIYHRLPKRIEAHICIAFVAYKVYKELERTLKAKKAVISPGKAIEIAQNIFEIEILTPKSKQLIKKVLLLSEEQKYLAEIAEF